MPRLLTTSIAASATLAIVLGLLSVPAAPAQAASSPHTVYVAIAAAKDAKAKSSQLSDSYVKAVVAKASAKWKLESKGALTFTVKKIVRYTSVIPCASRKAFDAPWYDEASKKFTSTKRTTFFGPGTKRHLVVMTPDGNQGFGQCAQATVREINDAYSYTYDASTLGGALNDGGSSHFFAGRRVQDESETFAVLGRNMGFDFSGVHFCQNETMLEGVTFPVGSGGSRCQTDARQDTADPRSQLDGQTGVLSVPAQFRAGFISASDVPLVTLGAGEAVSKTYTLAALSTRSGTRGVRIVDPVSGDTYWVEYRSTPTSWKGDGYWYPETNNGTTSAYRYYMGAGVRVLKEDFTNPTAPASLTLTTLRRTESNMFRNLEMGSGDGFSSRSGGVHVDVNWTDLDSASVTVTATRTPTLLPTSAGSIIAGWTWAGGTVSLERPNFRQLGVAYSYRWFLDGELVPNATSSSIRVLQGYVGRTLRGEVVGSLPGFVDGIDSTRDLLLDGSDVEFPATITVTNSDTHPGTTPLRVSITTMDRYWIPSDEQLTVSLSRNGQHVGAPVTTTTNSRSTAVAVFTSRITPGTYTITASTSEGRSTTATYVVGPATSTVAVVYQPLLRGVTWALRAPAGIATTGAVTISIDHEVVETRQLGPGVSTSGFFAVDPSKAPNGLVTVVYSGDANNTPSNASLVLPNAR